MEPYILIRARRKTLSLRVLPDGQLEVRAPLRLARRVIDGFVAEKAPWIAQRREILAQRAVLREEIRRDGPASLPYLGRELPWRLGGGKKALLDKDGFLLPGANFPQSLPALEELYRRLARQTLEPLTQQWANRLGLTVHGIRITGARGRWGSCSPKGWINYSWRLVLAPLPAVEGVVVHELCHLRQPDHSPRFWALVEAALPDYKTRQAPLEALSRRLEAEGWDRPDFPGREG